jgi:hypothetical protein
LGWGTFAAGQALSWTRGASKAAGDSSEFYSEIVYGLNNKFLQSYIRRVLQGTIILHPSIWNSVDLDYWEDEITKRAARDWRLLVFIQLVIFAIGFSTFWPLLLLYVPGFWYFGKNRAIKKYVSEINEEFAAEGFDVPKLFVEIPDLLEDEKIIEQEEVRKSHKIIEDMEYKQKFGKEKN